MLLPKPPNNGAGAGAAAGVGEAADPAEPAPNPLKLGSDLGAAADPKENREAPPAADGAAAAGGPEPKLKRPAAGAPPKPEVAEGAPKLKPLAGAGAAPAAGTRAIEAKGFTLPCASLPPSLLGAGRAALGVGRLALRILRPASTPWKGSEGNACVSFG